jgi:transcriptional regulator with XRE-family HTH domain
MDKDNARKFALYLTRLRKQQGLSIRGLAAKAGLDDGALTRLEHGKVHMPRPVTLKVLAIALEVPLADMLTMAGYVIPVELPSLGPYLHAKYGYLPEEAIDSACTYLYELIAEHCPTPD